MQKFSYHAHTNGNGVYDGLNSVDEMICRAQELGFESYGISNHFMCHPDLPTYKQLFFHDFTKALEQARRNIDEIREKSEKYRIPVYVGFEVDYFIWPQWRKEFEKILPKLEVDYLIGAVHTLQSSDGSKIAHLYDLAKTEEEKNAYRPNYWRAVKEAIQSGYFNWMAHLDLLKYFKLHQESDWEHLLEIAELLAKYQVATELNTGAMRRGLGEFYPSNRFLKELNRQNVLLLINDDAHSIKDVGSYYGDAELFLSQIDYKNRLKDMSDFKKMKKQL